MRDGQRLRERGIESERERGSGGAGSHREEEDEGVKGGKEKGDKGGRQKLADRGALELWVVLRVDTGV